MAIELLRGLTFRSLGIRARGVVGSRLRMKLAPKKLCSYALANHPPTHACTYSLLSQLVIQFVLAPIVATMLLGSVIVGGLCLCLGLGECMHGRVATGRTRFGIVRARG